MKLTVGMLREIIKEEVEKVKRHALSEVGGESPEAAYRRTGDPREYGGLPGQMENPPQRRAHDSMATVKKLLDELPSSEVNDIIEAGGLVAFSDEMTFNNAIYAALVGLISNAGKKLKAAAAHPGVPEYIYHYLVNSPWAPADHPHRRR